MCHAGPNSHATQTKPCFAPIHISSPQLMGPYSISSKSGNRGLNRNDSLVQELQPDGDMASIALASKARSSRPRVFSPVRSYQAYYGGVERDTNLLSSQVSTEGRKTQRDVKLLISYLDER